MLALQRALTLEKALQLGKVTAKSFFQNSLSLTRFIAVTLIHVIHKIHILTATNHLLNKINQFSYAHPYYYLERMKINLKKLHSIATDKIEAIY